MTFFLYFLHPKKSIEKPILRPREIRRSSLHRTPSLKNRVLKLKWSCLTKSSKSCNIGFEADSLLQRKTFLLRDKIWFVVSFFFLALIRSLPIFLSFSLSFIPLLSTPPVIEQLHSKSFDSRYLVTNFQDEVSFLTLMNFWKKISSSFGDLFHKGTFSK